MPEILVRVPSLQIPSANHNETENSSSAAETSERSTDRHATSPVEASETKSTTKMQRINKTRISSHGKRLRKKSQARQQTCKEEKAASSLKISSQIPRALVTTSSTTTLLANEQDSLASAGRSVAKQHFGKQYLKSSGGFSLVHQKSSLILAFRRKKSFSEMDFRHKRCQMNFTTPSPPLSIQAVDKGEHNNMLQLSKRYDNVTTLQSEEFFAHNIYKPDYYLELPRRDPQMASMKIFATIMLNAWRKRRDEVKRLTDEVTYLKRANTKTKNQLHVFNSLFRVEQKRNDELNFQLKRSLDNMNLTKSSQESLTTSLISLEADKNLLEQQLQLKEQEFESINTLLTQTKSELFKSMALQRELQSTLSVEQRVIQTLNAQKNELINELCELSNDALQKEKDLCIKIQETEDQVADLKKKLCAAEEKTKILSQSAEQQLKEAKTNQEHMKEEIELLASELRSVHKSLKGSIDYRLKSCWNRWIAYPKTTLEMLHLFAYYTFPAMPAPRNPTLPIALSLDKALSIVRR